MKPKGLFFLVVIAAVVLAGMFRSGWAQTTPPTVTVPPITNGLAHENVNQSLASRSPGRMVIRGVISSQTAVKFGRTNAQTITETDEDVDFIDGVMEGAVELILQQIEELFAYFVDLLLTRLGLPDFDFGNGNSNTNTNDNDNDNDNVNGNDNDNDNDNTNANDNDNDNLNTNTNTNTNTNNNDNTNRPMGVRKARS